MRIEYHRRFLKEASRLPLPIQQKLAERIKLLRDDSDDRLLNRHALVGEYIGYESINVTGDVRALYRRISNGHIEFVRVGTHSQLY